LESSWRTLDEALEASMAQPNSAWRSTYAELQQHGLSSAELPGLAEGVPTVMGRVASGLRLFHSVAIEPYWPAIRAASAEAADSWAHTMATQGVEAMLADLHPNISWDPPDLVVHGGCTVCPPSCPHRAVMQTYLRGRQLRFSISSRGLVIRPSIMSPFVHMTADGEGLSALAIPVAVNATVLLPEVPADDALADLLGATRAAVLIECERADLTTTELARTLTISVSSASEHAAVLRAKGLIESRRDRHRVLHRTTRLGSALIHGMAGVARPRDAAQS